jgi:DNA-binding protein, stimulates sugar fermentation
MRFSPELEEGRLIKRYKRFLADIETSTGELITIHCPNTGSMLNCMVEGGQVWFSRSNDPKRKLPGTWEISQTPQGRLACVNTGRANHLIEEALLAGVISELSGFTALKREVPYGQEKAASIFAWSTRRALPMSRSKVSPWGLTARLLQHSRMP